MLKFLDNRTHEKPQKSPKQYKPQFLFGNSFESPKQFQKSHTIFHNSSYVNPYLNYQQERLSKFPSQSLDAIHPKWRHKVDLHCVEQQKILSPEKVTDKQLPDLRHSRYLKSFHDEFGKKQDRFWKNKGEFTQFIEKNIKFKSLGPLHGDHRDESRINQTKRSVWIKTSKSMSESTKNSFLKSTDLNLSIRSSISKNSQLLTEKQRIRQNRQKVYLTFKKNLQRRKIQKANSHLFQLPKTGPEHQLTIFRHMYNSNNRFSLTQNKTNYNEKQEVQRDINKFQVTMYQKIK